MGIFQAKIPSYVNHMKDAWNNTIQNDLSGRIVILIPAYEPDEQLLKTVKGLLSEGLGPIVVVNDGSSPSSKSCFDDLDALGVSVCHHSRNIGKGAAIKTGIRYITEHFDGCRGVVTADADGQHSIKDICRVAQQTGMVKNTLILGVRDFSHKTVPWNSYAGNRITSLIFRAITHISCPDTQTGLRGIPSELFSMALAAEGDRYEYEMNFLLDVAEHKCGIDTVPIRTIYIDDNKSSHFRIVRDSFLIYRRPITFLLWSVSSSLVDLAAFYFFIHFLFQDDRAFLFYASVLARIISGCVNFILNKKLTFRSKGNTLKESGRYLCLFLAVMLVSSTALALLGRLPIPALPLKIVVDTLLFIVNYLVQRKWVFRKD